MKLSIKHFMTPALAFGMVNDGGLHSGIQPESAGQNDN